MQSPHSAMRVPGILTSILAVMLLAMTAGNASADPQPVPTTPAESAQPAASPAKVALEAVAVSSTVPAGGLVIIEGTLADQDGAPVSGVRIQVMLDDSESADSLVMTDETGAFQTFAEVPSERAAGEASLVVSFAGNDSYAATQQEMGLVVEQIPVAERASPDASPTVTDMAGASASVDASMVAGGNEDPAADTEDEERSPLSWFYVALVVVGGAALLITAGLVLRGIYGRSGEAVSRRAGSLDMLLDQASEDERPPGDIDADANSGEDAPPRRGIE